MLNWINKFIHPFVSFNNRIFLDVWELPEIHSRIAYYLVHRDYFAIVLACKKWNNIFIPYMYSNIYYISVWSRLPMTGLPFMTNGKHIRSLLINRQIDLPLFNSMESVTNLLELEIHGNQPIVISKLIQQNPAIQRIKWTTDSANDEIMSAVSNSPNLRTLILVTNFISQIPAKSLFNTCRHIRELEIDYMNYSWFNGDGILTKRNGATRFFKEWDQFPFLESLTFSVPTLISPQCCLEIVKRCPRLKSLVLPILGSRFPTLDAHKILSDNCPDLKELTLQQDGPHERYTIPDMHLSHLVTSCKGISYINARETEFGPLSLQSLQRNLSRMTHIELKGCHNLPYNDMITNIFVSCPLLTCFSANFLDAQDMLVISDQVKEREWVCLNIRRLEIDICSYNSIPAQWQLSILRLLSKLVRLEHLDIGRYYHDDRYHADNLQNLDLRLNTGLGILESLKRLKFFGFGGTIQKMRSNDVNWMMSAWPRLEKIQGKFHVNDIQCSRLDSIVSQIRLNSRT